MLSLEDLESHVPITGDVPLLTGVHHTSHVTPGLEGLHSDQHEIAQLSDDSDGDLPTGRGRSTHDHPDKVAGPSGRKEGMHSLVLPNDDNTGGVRALACSKNGRFIATGSVNHAVVLWNASNGDRVRECLAHTDTICSVAFSPDSQYIVSGSRDTHAILWKVATGERVASLVGHRNLVNTVSYSPDGQIIATGSTDRTIRLWNADGSLRSVLEGHNAMVMLLAFSSDSQRLVSASADYTARIWSTAPGDTAFSTLDGHEGVIYSIAFSPDNRKVVSGSDDGSTRIWSAESSQELVTLREHNGSVWAAVFSTDGKRVLSVASDGFIKVCDSLTGELVFSQEVNEGFSSNINAAAFSDDTKLCATATDSRVRVWNTQTGACIATLEGHEDSVSHLWFSPNGDSVISSSDDSTFRAWNLRQLGHLQSV